MWRCERKPSHSHLFLMPVISNGFTGQHPQIHRWSCAQAVLEPIPAVLGCEGRVTPWTSLPVHHRDRERETNKHPHSHSHPQTVWSCQADTKLYSSTSAVLLRGTFFHRHTSLHLPAQSLRLCWSSPELPLRFHSCAKFSILEQSHQQQAKPCSICFNQWRGFLEELMFPSSAHERSEIVWLKSVTREKMIDVFFLLASSGLCLKQPPLGATPRERFHGRKKWCHFNHEEGPRLHMYEYFELAEIHYSSAIWPEWECTQLVDIHGEENTEGYR